MASMTTSLWNYLTFNSTAEQATSIVVKNVFEKSPSPPIVTESTLPPLLSSSKLSPESSISTSRPPSYTSVNKRYRTRTLEPTFNKQQLAMVKTEVEGKIVAGTLAKNELKIKLGTLKNRDLKPVVVEEVPTPPPSKSSPRPTPSPRRSSSSSSTKAPYYTPGLSMRGRFRRRMAKREETWYDPHAMTYDDLLSIRYQQQLRSGTNTRKPMSYPELMEYLQLCEDLR
ncbi:hypothetical protein JCM5353_003081 [Sporobolomyces roseus]